jgi:hypothetical protein
LQPLNSSSQQAENKTVGNQTKYTPRLQLKSSSIVDAWNAHPDLHLKCTNQSFEIHLDKRNARSFFSDHFPIILLYIQLSHKQQRAITSVRSPLIIS